MSKPPNLLNDDGSASMATMLLMSHHAFRRDLARFLRGIEQIKAGDNSRVEALQKEWKTSYRQALHGHHQMEDTNIFPDILSRHPDLSSALHRLTEQHHHIDPLLEKGDLAFASLNNPAEAAAVLNQLKTLLDEHLAFEEANITQALRANHEFPVPPDDNIAAMYAQGFAWSMQGIDAGILEQVRKLLPEILLTKLPAAQVDFENRCKLTWGDYVVGATNTPIPNDF